MAIIFVDSTATGANNGTSWTDAYTSLNTAMLAANIAPGDQLLVSGTFNETVTIAEAGAATTPNLVQGDDKSGGAGVGSPAIFTIDGQSTRANGITSGLGAAHGYYVFKDMKVTGCTAIGVFLGGTDTITFKRCEFTNNVSWGIKGDDQLLCEECTFTLAAADGGVDCDNNCVFVGCKVYNNVGHGISMNNGLVFACEFFSNSGDNVRTNSGSSGKYILNCIFDGDGKDSDNAINYSHASSLAQVQINNIIYDCTTGITAAQDIGELSISFNNLLNGNTTKYAGSDTHSGEQTGAPLFTNEGTNDYTLQSGSPAKAAGADAGEIANDVSYMDIGAHQRQEPAGGGGSGMRLVNGGLVG
ncbi:hypothetical protein LCGC14_1047960 [marine sediment metagenome]|uniref:Right handed beta helix domain-containing protein n=1 Tax=marine sediment metagenome TaxID=412755 RepID=A0A0F9MPQ9_9ZZZZ